MVQILATIFFSAAALSAVGAIVSTFSDNLTEVRVALGLGERMPALLPARVRVSRVITLHELAKVPAGSPLRAAA